MLELCDTLAAHAPMTMRVTKEALRRLRRRDLPDGDDLVREAYGGRGGGGGVTGGGSEGTRPNFRAGSSRGDHDMGL